MCVCVGGGGLTKREGSSGASFTPYNKRMVKVLAMLKGGTKCFEVILTRKLEVLAILKGGTKGFHHIK